MRFVCRSAALWLPLLLLPALPSCGALSPSADDGDGVVLDDMEALDDARADRANIALRVVNAALPALAGRSEARRVFRSAASFRDYFGVGAPTGIDFRTTWLAYYSAGTRPTGGYAARVLRVRVSDAGGTLKVTTGLESPGSSCIVTQASSKPAVLVSFKRPATAPSTSRFYKSDTVRACAAPVPAPTDLTTLDLTLTNHVRAVYFSPRDRGARAGLHERLDTFVRIAQGFFAAQMKSHGFTRQDGAGKTFRFEKDATDGRARVVYLTGEHEAAHYHAQRDAAGAPDAPGAALAEILRRLPEAFHRNNVTLYFYDLATLDQKNVKNSGNGGSGAPWEGSAAGYVLQGTHFLGLGFDTVATRLEDQRARFEDAAPSGIEDWDAFGSWRELTRGEYASTMVGAAVHELGHAFYLGHVFTDYDGDGVENNLMGNGFRRFGGTFSPLGPKPATALGPEHARTLDASVMFAR